MLQEKKHITTDHLCLDRESDMFPHKNASDDFYKDMVLVGD
jgi:hypothetical protein